MFKLLWMHANIFTCNESNLRVFDVFYIEYSFVVYKISITIKLLCMCDNIFTYNASNILSLRHVFVMIRTSTSTTHASHLNFFEYITTFLFMTHKIYKTTLYFCSDYSFCTYVLFIKTHFMIVLFLTLTT